MTIKDVTPLASMDLNREEQMVRDIVRRIVDTDIRPRAVELDETEDFPWAQMKALSENGLLGILVPENLGGQEGSHVLYVAVIEEIARACAATALVYFTQTHAQLPLLLAGTVEQQKTYVPKLASGEWLGAFAITEPGNGSDVADMKTRAERVAGGYVLNGEKIFITTGDKADVLTVFARTGVDGVKGISAFIVTKGSPGFDVTRVEKKMGVRGSSTAALTFTDCFVPEENRLGEENSGFEMLMKAFDFTRLSTAAQSVGIAQGAYDIAFEYSLGRKQFGRKIYDFQAVQFRLAEMLTEISAGRALLFQTARMVDSGHQPFPLEASMAKLWCSEMAGRVTNEAVQVLGGYGYIREYGVERMMRDAKITQIYDGTNDIQKLVIARRALQIYSK